VLNMLHEDVTGGARTPQADRQITRRGEGWLNRTVLGVGTASFFSDVSHETATSLLPLLATELGSPAAFMGAVEGFSDAASGAAKIWSGWITDRLQRRKPLALIGYLVSAVAGAALGGAWRLWEAVAARSLAWAGRGIRTPPRNALLSEDVAPAHFGKAFGLERALDTLGAVAGPLAAAALLVWLPFRSLLWLTIVPGLIAALAMALLVRERPRIPTPSLRFLGALASLPRPYRIFLAAVGLFGLGDFAHSMLILRSIETLTPSLGSQAASVAGIGLYGLHNLFGAALALGFGAAADRLGRLRMLAVAYLLGPAMLGLLLLPAPRGAAAGALLMAAVFLTAGAMRAGESALESAAAAQLLPEGRRGMGFGVLAAVNSFGDLVSSLSVGLLWQHVGPAAAFGSALAPMLAGVALIGWLARNEGGQAPPVPSSLST